jgi:hypothetical protein
VPSVSAALSDRQGLRIEREGPRRAAEGVARELIEEHDQGQGASRLGRPRGVLASRRRRHVVAELARDLGVEGVVALEPAGHRRRQRSVRRAEPERQDRIAAGVVGRSEHRGSVVHSAASAGARSLGGRRAHVAATPCEDRRR